MLKMDFHDKKIYLLLLAASYSMGSSAQNLPIESKVNVEIKGDSLLGLTIIARNDVRTREFNPDNPEQLIELASLSVTSDPNDAVAVTFPEQSSKVRKCAYADGEKTTKRLTVCFPDPNTGGGTFDTYGWPGKGLLKYVEVKNGETFKILSSVAMHNKLLPSQPINKDNKVEPDRYTVRVARVKYKS
ncbi:hypothetical protein H9X98_22930 [Aeromonas jandaei]|uniref:hypothetical protein n=1 Tax=Aeromonas jandaei TaxID=650 RepID=UPI001F489C5E|nr:hypothetical protein [Aeromonas jandaei]MCF7720502.1 hypothetical protein [Aeromonas jandaei]